VEPPVVWTTADLPSGPLSVTLTFEPDRVDGDAVVVGVQAKGAVGRVSARGESNATPAAAGRVVVGSIGAVAARGVQNIADDDLIAVLMAA
jgi:hypothetical protein